MSSGNFDLTTYYAKRIIGDAAAATAANALLQTGDDITSNIWILHRTNRTTEKYGIHYAYDGTNGHDKIEFYGKGTNDDATAWVQLDTGDASFNNINSYGTITTMTLFLKNTTTDLTQSNNGSDNIIYHSIWGRDKNNNSWFCVEGYTNSSGSVAAFLGVRNYNTEGVAQSWKGFTITEDKSNNLTYTVSDPHAFRSAISTWALVSDSYNTFMPADGTTNGWYKFGTSNTSYGILPSTNGGAGNGHNYIGTSTWYWKYSHIDEMYGRNLTISGNNNGINFAGTKATLQMIRFIDADDEWGHGIVIGGGGLTILGSGESANTLFSNVGATGATETTYISSDNTIEFLPTQQNGYDISAHFTMTDGRFWAGVNGNTTRETSVGAQSGAGQIYMWSHAATSGSRGIYVPAHGTGAAKTVLGVDTNNNVTFYGTLSGTASNADKLDNVDSRGFLRVYLNSTDITSIDTVATDNYLYSHSDSGGFCSGTKPTGSHNGTAILHIRPHNDNYAQQIAFDTNQSAIWYRNANASTTFSDWTRIVTNSGTWSISITGNAATATRINGNLTAATSDVNRNIWVSSGSGGDGIPNYVSGFYINPSTNILSVPGNLRLHRESGVGYARLHFYSTFKTWSIYMSNAAASACPSGGTPSTLGDVTAWALRSYIENASGYGWIWESAAESNTGTPTARMALSSANGNLTVAGKIQSNVVNGGTWISGTKNASFYVSTASTASAGGVYQGWYAGKTKNGAWSLGSLSGGDVLYFVYGTDTNYNAGTNTVVSVRLESNGYFYPVRCYNAVWNDYAEFRECETLTPGVCVKENNNGKLTITTTRLIPGASIISDTYGYAEGETDKAKTPIAVSGRVLVYTYRDRHEYHAGQAVCSAPNGTVDIMSRDEIMMYPDAIVGIVSEIPEYEEWGTDHIKVNNRIWIKVK